MATWAEIGIFWGTLAAAVAAASAVAVSYFVYRSQTDPDVIVYVTTDPNRQGIVNLVIENIGRGVAKNVRFAISHPIPLHAFNGKPPEAMNRGPFVSGIPSLGPGARRVITWGQYFGLSAVLGRRVIRVTASYESDTQLPWAEHQLTRESFLDVMSFEGTDISDSNYTKQAASHL